MALRRLWNWIQTGSAPPDEPPVDLHQARESLTRRERQVLDMIGRGFSNAGAAYQLGMGEETVRTHLRNIYRKFGIHSRGELFEVLEKIEGRTSD